MLKRVLRMLNVNRNVYNSLHVNMANLTSYFKLVLLNICYSEGYLNYTKYFTSLPKPSYVIGEQG
jgi:hypothetical protein